MCYILVCQQLWQIQSLEVAHNGATVQAVSDSRKCKPKLNHLPVAAPHWEVTHVPTMLGRMVHSDPENSITTNNIPHSKPTLTLFTRTPHDKPHNLRKRVTAAELYILLGHKVSPIEDKTE